MSEIKTKDDLLNKLRNYALTPDDETIRYKEKIKQTFMKSPELLYALNEKDLESELFCEDEDGNLVINMDEETGELLGDIDRYFGENANIRPYLYIDETQTEVKNYVCYKVIFDELPKYNNAQKYTEIIFKIFVHGDNKEDKLTGIPRHDLIASIIREKFNWSNIFGMQTHIVSSQEDTTDNKYLLRTLIFQLVDTNGIYNTPYGGKTSVNNFKLRK